MVMQFKSCCCGCTLRTGTIIIGVLGLLAGISLIAEGLVKPQAQANNATLHEELEKALKPINLQNQLLPTTNTTNITQTIAGESGFKVLQAIIGFAQLIVSILLLVGVCQSSAKLVFPWICVNIILCVLNIINFLGLGIIILIAGEIGLGITYLIIAFIFTALQAYFILIVNSYHTTLKSSPVSRA